MVFKPLGAIYCEGPFLFLFFIFYLLYLFIIIIINFLLIFY